MVDLIIDDIAYSGVNANDEDVNDISDVFTKVKHSIVLARVKPKLDSIKTAYVNLARVDTIMEY